MNDNVKWTSDLPKFDHMLVEGLGYLKLIDGVWTDQDGRQYTVQNIDGVMVIESPGVVTRKVTFEN